mgnify:CR=1 FL=1
MLSPAALDDLRSYRWPGNVRELQNCIERAVIMSEGRRLTAPDMELADAGAPASGSSLKDAREALERGMVTEALRKHNGNITSAATELDCGRSTIREALTQLSTLGVVASRRGSGAHVLDWRKDGMPALLPYYLPQAAIEGQGLTLVRELLEMRRLLAQEAVRLAVRYGDAASFAGLRGMFERSLGVNDPVAHVAIELEIFRGLVVSSKLWPAVWFANAFWVPLRDLHSHFAPLAGGPPPDYASSMKRLLDLVEARKEREALRHVAAYLARVDQLLLGRLTGEPEPAAKPTKTTKAKPKRPSAERART